MNYGSYVCPVCGDSLIRDVKLFLEHTNHHICEKLKARGVQALSQYKSCGQCGEVYAEGMPVA